MGYDRCWVLNDQDKGLRFVASAYEPASGRMLEVFSDEPSIQLNSGNFLDGTLPNKSNGTYLHRTGFCFETQHYPDLPNQKNFPSIIESLNKARILYIGLKLAIKDNFPRFLSG